MEEKQNDLGKNPSEIESPSAEAQAFNEMAKQLGELRKENESLQKAKRDYYDAVLNGMPPADESVQKSRSAEEIRKDLREASARGCSNLEYMTLALELDDACIEETGVSCFLPKGHDQNGNPITPTAVERETARKFHEVMSDCVNDAAGDPDAFNVGFARAMK